MLLSCDWLDEVWSVILNEEVALTFLLKWNGQETISHTIIPKVYEGSLMFVLNCKIINGWKCARE